MQSQPWYNLSRQQQTSYFRGHVFSVKLQEWRWFRWKERTFEDSSREIFLFPQFVFLFPQGPPRSFVRKNRENRVNCERNRENRVKPLQDRKNNDKKPRLLRRLILYKVRMISCHWLLVIYHEFEARPLRITFVFPSVRTDVCRSVCTCVCPIWKLARLSLLAILVNVMKTFVNRKKTSKDEVPVQKIFVSLQVEYKRSNIAHLKSPWSVEIFD